MKVDRVMANANLTLQTAVVNGMVDRVRDFATQLLAERELVHEISHIEKELAAAKTEAKRDPEKVTTEDIRRTEQSLARARSLRSSVSRKRSILEHLQATLNELRLQIDKGLNG